MVISNDHRQPKNAKWTTESEVSIAFFEKLATKNHATFGPNFLTIPVDMGALFSLKTLLMAENTLRTPAEWREGGRKRENRQIV